MKNILILICIIVIIIGAGFIYATNKDYTIPENYIQEFTSDMSQTDGPKITYYVYSDKIISVYTQDYPTGHPYKHEKEITLYDGLTIDENNINNYKSLISDKEGKVVLTKKW